MIRRALAIALAAASLAASCSGTSSDEARDSASTTTEAGATGTTVGDTASDSVELSATDTGVTESVIRVGAVVPDTALIGRDPGDLEAKFQVIADSINAAGGINGRDVELVFRTVSPLDDTSYEAVCVELVEDLEVFAAVGVFLRENADCYGALNDTIVINAFPITADDMDDYTATGITIEGDPLRLVGARIDALIDGGILAAGTKVALFGLEQASENQKTYAAALEAAGLEVVADTIAIQTLEDALALNDEMQRFTEVWKSNGAEVVMASSALSSQALLGGYNNGDIDLPMILPEGTGVDPSLLQASQGLDLAPFELAVALVEGSSQAAKYEDGVDGVRECVDRFEEATGEEVSLDESRNNLAPTIVACQVFDVFSQVATAAGPNLTRASFRAAAEAFGPISVTDLAEASLGPGKFNLADSVGVVAEFNPETLQFEPIV